MLEKIKKCPICNHDKFVLHITCKDYLISGELFEITQCTNCSFLFTNPRPASDNLASYYESDTYVSHSNKSNNLTNFIYKIARHFTLNHKLKIINDITNIKTILDYGCGTGHFLTSCKKNGWSINGFEPNNAARKHAILNTDTTIFSKLSEIEKLNDISLITLWHVLEHIPDLNNIFSILKSRLSSNGKFLIAVPNSNSFDAIHYKKYWAAYDVPRHLYHFSMNTMMQFLQHHGLKIYKTIPMKLDSYYVSLLSEKSINGKNNYIKSFINGYKSNVYANKNKNNYSSLIYIAGK